MAPSSSSLPVRKWGPGTAAIARTLIAAKAPITQVALARAVGVSQPRASQVLKHLTDAHAVSASPRGYRGRPARLLELYRDRARPHLVAPETFWYSTRPLIEQAERIADIAPGEGVALAFSADLGPDLLASWRHPTLTIVYADRDLPLDAAGLVPAEGRVDASILWRRTRDATLLTAPEPWPRIVDHVPLTDPVQQWWDLHDLGGEDRREAADRLRRAIIDKSIAIAA
jgi:DNA-binding transcriptional ArsR family regulator